MRYFFYIVDRLGGETLIDDPIGWDGMSIVLQRDKEKHGLFFDYQGNTFEYIGMAAQMLRNEYETYGVEGNMSLKVNYECNTGEKLLYLARFSFAQWEDEFGEDCSVRLPVETASDLMMFRNRIDQKVDLQTAASFEGEILNPYTYLPFTQTLPGKSIFVQDFSRNNVDVVTSNWQGTWVDKTGSTGAPQMAFFIPGYEQNIAAEIGSVEHPNDAVDAHDQTMPTSWVAPPASWVELPYYDTSDPSFEPLDSHFPFESLSPIINYDVELGKIYGNDPITLDLELTYDKTVHGYTVFGSPVTTGIRGWNIYLGVLAADADPNNPSSWFWFSNIMASPWAVYNNRAVGIHTPLRHTFNFTGTLVLRPGDRVYYFEKLLYQKNDALQGSPAFSITSHAGSFFKVSGLSHIPDTDCKLFMAHEALSRVTEAITNDRVRLRSEFYGRTDSEPYSYGLDGCGSLHAITQGGFIRRLELTRTTKPPIFSLSIKDLWEGLNPIHNIGMGIEADPDRAGFSQLRVEPWHFFYSEDVILECIGVRGIKRKVKPEEHVGIFKFGYQKWEAEEYTGLDEYMTQREYRTELTQVNNTFTKISQFIGSPFAWEVTRRLGNDTSEDWRYDKDTFIVSMQRDGLSIEVELGQITDPSNIVDPTTIYNFRDRPSVMAMRWLPYVLASYKQAGFSSKIIFTDGTGNVYAAGYLTSSWCRDEAATAGTEKDTITPMSLGTPSEGLPAWELEEISFDFPVTIAEFQTLQANPNGLIYVEGDNYTGYGWIDTITYKPEEGKAEFSLIPKRS